MEMPDVLFNWLLSPAFIYAQIHRCHFTIRPQQKCPYLFTLQKPLYDFISYCTIRTMFVLEKNNIDLDVNTFH